MEEGSKKQMELPWMEGMLFNKNITFGTVLDGRNGVREILFRNYPLWRKSYVFLGWSSPMEGRKVVFFLVVKPHGGEVPWKEGRL